MSENITIAEKGVEKPIEELTPRESSLLIVEYVGCERMGFQTPFSQEYFEELVESVHYDSTNAYGEIREIDDIIYGSLQNFLQMAVRAAKEVSNLVSAIEKYEFERKSSEFLARLLSQIEPRKRKEAIIKALGDKPEKQQLYRFFSSDALNLPDLPKGYETYAEQFFEEVVWYDSICRDTLNVYWAYKRVFPYIMKKKDYHISAYEKIIALKDQSVKSYIEHLPKTLEPPPNLGKETLDFRFYRQNRPKGDPEQYKRYLNLMIENFDA